MYNVYDNYEKNISAEKENTMSQNKMLSDSLVLQVDKVKDREVCLLQEKGKNSSMNTELCEVKGKLAASEQIIQVLKDVQSTSSTDYCSVAGKKRLKNEVKKLKNHLKCTKEALRLQVFFECLNVFFLFLSVK